MKTTQKDIRNTHAVDITYRSFNEINDIVKNENGLTNIAYSVGTYGLNGAVFQGYKTNTLYKVTSRSTALFQLI